MSIDILQNARKAYSIHDDIESTFWVFYYTALHFFKIKLYGPIQGKPSLNIFDEIQTKTSADGEIVYLGGDLKHAALTMNKIVTVEFECSPLTEALHEFASTLRKYHLWRGAINENERAPHEQAVCDMGKVDPLIDRFQELIDTGEWPKGDDAGEDQYKKKSELDKHIQFAGAHEACVTHLHEPPLKAAPHWQPTRPDNGASSSMPPPAFVPVGRVTRSVTRKNAENAPQPVASDSDALPSMSRSTSKRHRVSDEDAKVEVEGSEGHTKRSRQQKTKAIVRTASSEQKNYNTRSRPRSLKQGVES
ncbi:hypothetical protein BC629DRAFT_1590123 [Irpex lacteus]|nr:hypothetical protein BC629DRAFT_1590123 [Irpex lacteus]